MKLPRLIALLSLIFVLSNCSDDENPSDNQPVDKEVYFSLNIDNSYITSGRDYWIIISSENGDLLDYRSFESGETLEFETETTNLSDDLNITFLNAYTDSTGTYHYLNTYAKISRGSTWNLKTFPFQTPPNPSDLRGGELGDAQVTVTNIPELILNNVSNVYGNSGSGGSGTTRNGLTTTTLDYSIYENTSENLITIVDGNREIKYKFFQNAQPNQEIEIDYSEFLDFDTTIVVDVPPNSTDYFSIVLGFEENQEFTHAGGFFMNLVFPFDFEDLDQNPVKLGYLDRFGKYITQVNFKFGDNMSYAYEKYGAKPDAISLPENLTITVNDETLQNFDFSTNIEFKRRSSSWRFSSGERNVDFKSTSWAYHSPTSDHVPLVQIPEEIKVSLPEINLENLIYSGTNFHLDFDTYQEFIDTKFVSPIDLRDQSSEQLYIRK